jgi:putative ATP-dependent endonuclease of the OLD family
VSGEAANGLETEIVASRTNGAFKREPMRLRHLKIENFRGIKELNWTVMGQNICLIGQGDSGKSTILDAIEFVLSPRWNETFADSDFFAGQTSSQIIIEATVGELPEELLTEGKFGLFQRGWHPEKGFHDGPEDDHENVITVQLLVDDSLEPQWSLVFSGHSERPRIMSKDREKLGMARLGVAVDKELSWGRGSALSRLTLNLKDVNAAIAEVSRAAREAFEKSNMTGLNEAANQALTVAGELGVCPGPGCTYKPGLDTRIVSYNSSAISLHQGDIPLRSIGLGSRRLVALAIQRSAVPLGAIMLIDEVEHGLEPHRVRHLLRHLKKAASADSSNQQSEHTGTGQVVMVTHSPIVIEELPATDLQVVRRDPGTGQVEVVPCSIDLQGIVRQCPSALLARRIIVCEGKTEYGFLRAMDLHYWTPKHENRSLAYQGVTITEAGGGRNQSPKTTLALSRLPYEIAYLGDSDEPIDPGEEILKESGVEVFLWPGGKSIEERVACDLPLHGLQQLLELVLEEHSEQSVTDAVSARLSRRITGTIVSEWTADECKEQMVRNALGTAAKKKEWFKHIHSGEKLGKLVAEFLPKVEDTSLAHTIKKLEAWVYNE